MCPASSAADTVWPQALATEMCSTQSISPLYWNALIDSFQYHKTDHMLPLKLLQEDILDVRNRFIVGSLNTKAQ